MIKIGIDASRLNSKMTGVGRYAAGIISQLGAVMPDAQFILYARKASSIELPSERWSIQYDRHPFFSLLPTMCWVHFRLGSVANADKLDVFWAPNTLIPKNLDNSIPCVATVLDFNHIFVPETLPPVTRMAYRRWMDADIKAAKMNVAISQGTAARMYELLGRHADAIAYPAVPSMPCEPAAAEVEQTLSSLGVRRPFLLTVGTRAPRKNLSGAVTAVQQLRDKGSLLDYQLVMAGPEAWDRGGRSVERGEGRNWIKALGFVSDASLAVLYAHAEALVFPSLYEGFGMPVIEARTYGCRVVTTDSPELREAGGEDAIYTDTTAAGIAAGIQEAINRPRAERKLVEYSWKQAAEVMAGVFRRAIL